MAPHIDNPDTVESVGGHEPEPMDRPIRWWGRTPVRLTVCFVFVATVPLAITAIYTTQRHLGVVRTMAARAASDRAATVASVLAELLEATANDTLALAEWPVLHSYLASEHRGSQEAFWREKFRVQVQTFMELNVAYGSVSLIDAREHAEFRMERRGTAMQIVAPQERAESSFQNWGGQATTLLARQTRWQVVGNGPHRSVLACAARVPRVSAGDPVIVVLEVDISPAVASVRSASEALRVAVLDQRGASLFDFGGAGDAPDWPTTAPGQFIDASGRLVSIASVATNGTPAGWKVAVAEPASVLEEGVADYRAAFLVVLIGSLLLAVMLGVWISLQITRPVRQLYEATRRIGRGAFDVVLPQNADDELGALSGQVGRMASQLREAHESFEQRLKEKTEKLIQADRLATIGRTAAAVAHEINNPSGIISLYAQMLTERLPSDDPNVPKLRVIESKSREISQIVRELLDYARKPAPEREWTEVEPLVQQAVEDACSLKEPTESHVGLATEVEIEADAKSIHVDWHQMSRVIRNLASNAIQAMPDGGVLGVRCRRGGDACTIIEITDTGVGISPEHAEHLFDPFHSTKRFGAGTGLGLAISKEIVERHGGTIAVASQPGRGTTVTIRIPDDR